MNPISRLLTKLVIAIITFQTHIDCQFGPIPYNDDGTWKISVEEKSNIFYPNFCFMTKLRYEKSDSPYGFDHYPLLFCINFEILLNYEDDAKQKVPYLKLKKLFMAKIIKKDLDSNYDPEVDKDTKIDSPYKSEDELMNDNFQFLVYQNFGEDSYAEKYHKISFQNPENFYFSPLRFIRMSYMREEIRFLAFGFDFRFENKFSLNRYHRLYFRDKEYKNEDLERMDEDFFESKELTLKFHLNYYDFRRSCSNYGVGPISMEIFPAFSEEMTVKLITKFEEFKSSTESHLSSEVDQESKVKQLFRLPTESEKSDLVNDFTKLFKLSECADSLGKIDYIESPKKNSQVDLEGGEEENKDKSEETDNENENEKINNNNDNNKGMNENKNKDERKASLGKKILMIVIVFSIFIILGGSHYYFYSKKKAIKL